MTNRKIIIIASGLAAAIAAWIVAGRKKAQTAKAAHRHFRKSRHLTPVFAHIKKHS